ncbi:MAG: hypothetical protein AAB731_03080 [Patescibacteria group bacterium]
MAYEAYRRALKKLTSPFDKHEHWRKTAKALKALDTKLSLR